MKIIRKAVYSIVSIWSRDRTARPAANGMLAMRGTEPGAPCAMLSNKAGAGFVKTPGGPARGRSLRLC
jgi:hypothetical protein